MLVTVSTSIRVFPSTVMVVGKVVQEVTVVLSLPLPLAGVGGGGAGAGFASPVLREELDCNASMG